MTTKITRRGGSNIQAEIDCSSALPFMTFSPPLPAVVGHEHSPAPPVGEAVAAAADSAVVEACDFLCVGWPVCVAFEENEPVSGTGTEMEPVSDTAAVMALVFGADEEMDGVFAAAAAAEAGGAFGG